MTWHAKRTGSYSPSSSEAYDNATEAARILINDFGWHEGACAGLFGNIDYEGVWNPWRWEGDNVKTRSQAQSTSMGYGLIGWTPARKYQFNNATTSGGVAWFPNYDQESYPGYGPNWDDVAGVATDGAAQIRLIGEAMARSNPNIWIQRKSCSQHRFITLDNPEQAAYYWLWNAEYPASIGPGHDPTATEHRRMTAARAWAERLDWNLPGCCPFIILMKKGHDHMRGLL